ncbi:hypothetical protein TNCT_170751 [Trichonephila clavata]|uniref:Uncharacterized protein n=1 Tax=Trichonephila clavata TaxID=2740835 RepID=A0A8X6I6C2_TRICU|nr:hypothetical protein TNCT_170751 [Trichonephila clavata]
MFIRSFLNVTRQLAVTIFDPQRRSASNVIPLAKGKAIVSGPVRGSHDALGREFKMGIVTSETLADSLMFDLQSQFDYSRLEQSFCEEF